MPIPVVCAILVRDNHILLAQRPEGKHLALKWEFPGGKVEPGEEPDAALIREIQEELGCSVRIVAALERSEHIYDRGTIEMIPLVCELNASSAEPVAQEHAAIVWVMLDQIEGYDLAPADWPVVEALREWWGPRTPRPAIASVG